jgi:hypothetical protein
MTTHNFMVPTYDESILSQLRVEAKSRGLIWSQTKSYQSCSHWVVSTGGLKNVKLLAIERTEKSALYRALYGDH